MTELMEQNHDSIPESRAAKLAYYTAFIPLAGFLFFILFGFLALIQIGKGRTGFNLLGKGLTAVVLLSVLQIAGLIYWAELPSDCYPVLNKLTKHGRYSALTNGQLVREEYYRFGQQFRAVTYGYHANGKKRSQATWVDGKLNGKSYYWFDNEQLRADEIFVNGKRQGRFTWYTRDGKLDRSMDYTDGISQEQIEAAKQAGVEPIIEVNIVSGVKMRMIFIPPGEFMMGSPNNEIGRDNNEGPQHKVVIKQGFYMCETEVTEGQWMSFIKQQAVNFSKADYPTESVPYNSIQYFLKDISYKNKDAFLLPSEAEWEYVCRSGATTRFGFGENDADLEDYAYYNQDVGELHPVGQKKANNWGIYDMHGNVSEWCEDNMHQNYNGSPSDGQPWIDNPCGESHVIRGGTCNSYPEFCRSAYRTDGDANDFYWGCGFRIIKHIVPPEK